MDNGHGALTKRRIGFVATRLAGTDGVSLETAKWVQVLERMGHACFYFAGQCDLPPDRSRVVPEAFFQHPEISVINDIAYSSYIRPPGITRRIHELAEHLKEQLYAFTHEFDIEILIVENALAIPLNIPLGLAITEFVAETATPTIAHHHDFFWERKRFLVNCVWDYLNMSFPPHMPHFHHAVINSSGANQLSLRTGISSVIIPNVMDFDNPPAPPDGYTADLRENLGVLPTEWLVLQPTRVVQRKGIEHAIELLDRLGMQARLVISHASGDEGDDYEKRVRDYARLMQIQATFVSDIIGTQRGRTHDGRKIYTLEDVYPHADLITYPSTFEGFGNAFLEAIYFNRPLVVNNYSIYAIDIKPRGFKVIEFDNYITDQTVNDTLRVLENPHLVKEWADHNYQLARRYYSYSILERSLQKLLVECFGIA